MARLTAWLTAWKKTTLIALAIGPMGAPLLLGATTAPGLRSELALALPSGSSQGSAAPAQFEVASVKPNQSPIAKTAIVTQPGGRFTATNVTLRQLILNAYDLQDSQVSGGPSWLASDRFDIVAKAEGAEAGDPFQSGKGGGPSRGQQMLRALLAERFKLATHAEARDLPIFAMVLARGDRALGPQLHRSPRDCDAPDADGRGRGGGASTPAGQPCGMRVFPGTIVSGGAQLAQLANGLSTLVGRIVRDRTGLTGNFEFTLRWTPDQIPQGFDRKAGAIGLAPIDPDGPSIFTAVREQLGLKLESQKGPVDVLVIDRAEHPIGN
jgi:uncharacterized protein (TIGR03435 family)